jgi:hypothetical protein
MNFCEKTAISINVYAGFMPPLTTGIIRPTEKSFFVIAREGVFPARSQSGGLPDISRGLSEAIPPDSNSKNPHHPEAGGTKAPPHAGLLPKTLLPFKYDLLKSAAHQSVTPAEFKTKWAKVTAKESAAYQSHFDDLCRMLGLQTPLEADPAGEFFCYQKHVIKNAELSGLDSADSAEPNKRGFSDVWKKDCFGWEYKGKKKSLDEAYKQLLLYREALLNPPLLVVCDFDRYIIRTNFNGTVQEPHEFTNAEIDRPENLRLLRAAFEDPEYLKPQRTTAQVTENLAKQIAQVARSLQKREALELADAKTRAEMNVGQRKNLRIARFLNRIVFCFFAEDTGLLPKNLFTELLKTGIDDLKHFARTMESLFAVMAKGGTFGKDKIRHFNGHLFEESTVFELTADELRELAKAGEADWQYIEPSIMGTLFERALEPEQRSQLGAHYTSEADIKTLVEPVLMAPLRREWSVLKGELAPAYATGKGSPAQREKLAAFQKKLAGTTVLDPACGSGNFLYVSLQTLLKLEKEVITFAIQLGFKFAPQVGVQQLRAIEINPYAFELAQASVQIGYLQWRRDNGFENDRTPVLQVLDGFHNEDALLVPHFRSKAKTLKEAQADEHRGDNALKFYTEREWPKCDVIVGNPPFLGDKLMRGELGDYYVEQLREIYGKRIPGQSDLCCYWFEKARELIEKKGSERAGLLATQGIRGGANRAVLKRIKETGDIFFAESDREWILNGAMVHVSMVGFDGGREGVRYLDGISVTKIAPNLSAKGDTTVAARLDENELIGFIGVAQKAPFDLSDDEAKVMLEGPNPTGRPNSDVIIPIRNAEDLTRRYRRVWNVDFGLDRSLEDSARYQLPFEHIKRIVYPIRINHREARQTRYWWLFARPCPDMRAALAELPRFFATPRVSKHRVFVWLPPEMLCDSAVVAFARSDDYAFGVLHSRFHEVWALGQGTQLREIESGFRYTPSTCFETFPFPFTNDLQLPEPTESLEKPTRHSGPDRTEAELLAAKYYPMMGKEEPPPFGVEPKTPAEHRVAIAAAAKELNEFRERWLNPPEWTVEKILEFPGSENGPWQRYLDANTVNAKTGIGTVRYPRLEPRDADCAAKLKKRTLTNLYNERPAWLDFAHKKLDAAVAAAYGWPPDLTGEQILEKLLALNLERAAEEANNNRTKKPKVQREKHTEEMI